jgi:UDP-glucose 6-dehydrogenase
MGVDCRFFQTDIITASLTKYMENSFFAMKVTFCNEWFDIARAYEVDYNELRELWLADPRINRNHTLVFPDNRGYGGKCYPKDTKAIIYDVCQEGYKPELMLSMDKVNTKFKKEQK